MMCEIIKYTVYVLNNNNNNNNLIAIKLSGFNFDCHR